MNIIKLISFVGWICLMSTTLSSQAKDFNDASLTHVEFPSWFANDPFFDMTKVLADARSRDKQGLMVVYTTQGCSYCGLFIEKSLKDQEIVAKVQKHFESMGLEIFNDTDLVGPRGQDMSIKDFAKQEGVMFSPAILFYDLQGKRIYRITGYQSPERFKTSLNYVTGRHYQSRTFADYVEDLSRQRKIIKKDTKLRDDSLFAKPPYHLQRNVIPASHPLLVIFEQAGCEECDEFHDKVLGDRQIRALLKKYEVVRLDNKDDKSVIITPDGKRTTPAQWYKQKGFSRTPALLLFNESGYEGIMTDNLVLQNRMINSINFMNERAYTKGWSYQRFARTRAIEKRLNKKMLQNKAD